MLQWGLKHYWDAQLDADLESDALGWQYCAGCMAGEGGLGNAAELWQRPLLMCIWIPATFCAA